MQLTLVLGGQLRHEASDGSVERSVDVAQGATVGDVMQLMGLGADRVKLALVNGRGATSDTRLQDGDRVALFPPELSFNTFVSLSFRQERVAARLAGEAREEA
jgi:molybdopterin converting factor small subunit